MSSIEDAIAILDAVNRYRTNKDHYTLKALESIDVLLKFIKDIDNKYISKEKISIKINELEEKLDKKSEWYTQTFTKPGFTLAEYRAKIDVLEDLIK